MKTRFFIHISRDKPSAHEYTKYIGAAHFPARYMGADAIHEVGQLHKWK